MPFKSYIQRVIGEPDFLLKITLKKTNAFAAPDIDSRNNFYLVCLLKRKVWEKRCFSQRILPRFMGMTNRGILLKDYKLILEYFRQGRELKALLFLFLSFRISRARLTIFLVSLGKIISSE